MRYLGSKRIIAGEILPIVLKNRRPNQYYVEPFVGGCNMIDKVDGLRIGADSNSYLISMWNALQSGWVPPDEVTEDMYRYYNLCRDIEDPAMVAFVGFLCSFAGKFFAGYARDKNNTNYALRGRKSLLNQLPLVMGVDMYCCSYECLDIPPNSIIYCDPPYEGTTGYKQFIDHAKFWQWCRDKAYEGHEIYVSEYAAPDDFVCLKSIVHSTGVNMALRETRIEKLFTFDPLF